MHKRILGSGELSPRGRSLRLSELLELVIVPRSLALYKDASCLLLPRAAGTLDAIVRAHAPLPESAVAFYGSRMLRAVELLFSADVLHGDLKLDNFVVFPTDFSGCGPGDGAGGDDDDDDDAGAGMAGIGKPCELPLRLTVIDFGRAIDRRAYGSSATRFAFNDRTLASFGQDSKELVPAAQWRRFAPPDSTTVAGAGAEASDDDGPSSSRGGAAAGWCHELDLHALAVTLLKLITSPAAGASLLGRHHRTAQQGGGGGGTGDVASSGGGLGLKVSRGWDGDLWSGLIGDLLNPHIGKTEEMVSKEYEPIEYCCASTRFWEPLKLWHTLRSRACVCACVALCVGSAVGVDEQRSVCAAAAHAATGARGGFRGEGGGP